MLSLSKPPNEVSYIARIFLILDDIVTHEQQSKNLTKRFHLTEFRTPYAPDQDQQELPNSVAFDFLDGRTMQCACHSHQAQAQVLQSKFFDYRECSLNADSSLVFREAQDAWIAYNQGS